ncbi:transcriptional regulator [Bacillus thuringiensis serovar pingluonsis]|uniref:Transcriptional regulator n=1 Tax=Bacillus thuringiensis serovar pingluonsis TaxID=180881 RepID=A0A243B509_BACTU|nr:MULTISPECIES: metalloregulator ArsR/SmtB family transcription factor [Bacillus cereus group]MEB9685417.1 metalloregulator ArsR/SmtB family transcription factor [Bacillus anthracis]OPD56217.1 transcriptional regulator [Bacillus anthracis]OTY39595.1 transcriptional regulator [Bacillus thuringiensis serovar pingluonsis]
MTEFIFQSISNMNLEKDTELLRVMSHPIRLKIVNELSRQKTLNVTELTNILNIPQSTVSQHLSKMKGIVLKKNRKGTEIYYELLDPKAEKIIKLLNHKQ